MTKRVALGSAAAAGLFAGIVAANYLTTRFGFVPVGFGLAATAGTFAAGVTLALRDAIQDTLGRRRYEYARFIGCDSVDGTKLTFAPGENLPKVLNWVGGSTQGFLTFTEEI